MKQITYIILAVLLIVSCSQPDRIDSAFKNYAKINFGNPKDFVEITECIAIDSLYYEDFYEENMREVEEILNEEELSEFSRLKQAIQDSDVFIMTYNIKVRVRHGDRTKIVKYYVYDYGDEIKIKEDKWTKEDIPKCYYDYLIFLRRLTH